MLQSMTLTGAIASLIVLALLLVMATALASALFPRQFDYRGKHVCVTGGSSGIGLEAARIYLKLGANVSILARNAERLAEAKADLDRSVANNGSGRNSSSSGSGSGRVVTVSVDCAESESAVALALAPALRSLGPVSVLVNCAGVSIAGTFEQTDISEFERMLRINVLGSVYPTRAVLGGMKAQGGGRIVFVASQVAQVALHGYTAYAASKWALRGLAEALQMEVKAYNVLVSVCYPPDTDTPGYKEEMESKPPLTKALSEAGTLFTPAKVALDLVRYSTLGYFGISTGVDGWLLKQLHPGMGPVNVAWEVGQQVLLSGVARVVGVFYVLAWEGMARRDREREQREEKQR